MFRRPLLSICLVGFGLACRLAGSPLCPIEEPILQDRLPVSGRVVGPSGEGIRGASVWFYRSEDRPSEGASEVAPTSPFRKPHPSDAEAVLVFKQAAITDTDGSFAAVLMKGGGVLTRSEWFLDVTASGWVSTGVALVGPSPITFEVVFPRRVLGQLLLSGDLDPRYVTVEMAGRRTFCDGGGGFEIHDVPPGTHDLSLFLGFDERAAIIVPEIQVDPLTITDVDHEQVVELNLDRIFDVRLMDIDLSEVTRFLTIHALRPDGTQESSFLVGPLASISAPAYSSQASSFTLPTAQESVDVAVCAYPSRVLRLRGVIGDVQVILPPPIEIEISLAGGAPLPAAPWGLVPRIEPVLADTDALQVRASLSRYLDVGFVGDRRRARMQLADTGSYRVAWALQEGAQRFTAGFTGSSFRSDVISEWYPIEVRDTWQEQVFPVPLSPAELDAALRDRR